MLPITAGSYALTVGPSQVITLLGRTVGIGVNWHGRIATTTRSAVFSGVLMGAAC
ncbi:hypothetical protein HJC02_15470 [Rhizobium sp. NLR4a]|uniref:hypothetical protein n=1 Tax=unclassified Rhizobium TaxID=2613769 RepID=UPI001C83399E|nr:MULTISPECIES: hypothetical protein [unclassified Rhizobium]MBX5233652.1 hypothetical protein [Rhizobium sp. NLR4a]MBX5269730.1 hypothetical protein [Rhizobium sp. NLR17b]MBX5301193.1 hypothetical protein [Rhizobium sp. NLR12b]